MPAINPTRLKQETAELVPYFSEPARFVYELDKLLDRYADRVRRPGQTGAPAPLLPAYKVAPPVMRQIVLVVTPLADADPASALALADLLWEKNILESRQIAVRLLGLLPADDPAPFLTRAQTWPSSRTDEAILEEFFKTGLVNLQKQHPRLIIEIVRDWLGAPQIELQTLGAKALLPLVENPAFDNLPLVFRMLLPRMIDAHPVLRGHLAVIIHALARRSPRETAHFLNQVLIVSDNPGIAWITRQVLDLLPKETQERLKETIRNRS
ncbi:MAG: DNA alkylation repair protein [Anaerolineales bacterium]|nr:DNA alkylation repair protein [Anaerolineales bacterium]